MKTLLVHALVKKSKEKYFTSNNIKEIQNSVLSAKFAPKIAKSKNILSKKFGKK
jgi:hypothetical protein